MKHLETLLDSVEYICGDDPFEKDTEGGDLSEFFAMRLHIFGNLTGSQATRWHTAICPRSMLIIRERRFPERAHGVRSSERASFSWKRNWPLSG